ncbi:ATP-binding protein [Marinobacter psychrophilus]|jgi:two-component system sensor histidine kinase PhoQ|uniref:ATP-binding protein n=1 Tax=Marinobacter psychrophilus TaxID=330734 RepID=UPI001B6D4515|nr:ATP-binding protein [Marinobacter psychrophilus]MBQ0761965.1 GHKL domain-containing protein [Marinobacter psychrophilus]MBQ0844103.1 GHKL domain-containing protein [Marinobacter psychrophilus]
MTLFKKPVSVKGALLTLLLPAGIALMAIAWFVHGLLLERMSREFVESRLKDEVAFLELHIRQAEGKIDMLKTGDYFEKVFHHAFAIQSPDQTVISPQSWQPLLNPLLQFDGDESIRVHNAKIANAPSDILAYRKSFVVNGVPIKIIVSEDMGALKSSQAELHAWTAIVSILLIFLLVGIIWFGINLSMRPVVSLQAALKRLQSGEISRIDAEAPEEFQPLVQQLNQLLDSLDQRLDRSREALANLSHSVKTPIAAVRQVLEDTSRPLDHSLRHEMGSRLGDIDKQLEAEMRRSRFAGPQVGKSAFPVKQARDLLWMLGRLYPEKSFELSTSLTEEFRWPIEEHDLNEILGNLLDNAGKWSAECVELSLKQRDGLALIVVTDDGAGVLEDDQVHLGQRGRRLDEQTPGHGLGLAIVREIVARYGGETSFSNGSKGGFKVLIVISI